MSKKVTTERFVKVDKLKTMTKANYARKMNVSQTTVDNWIKAGQLKTVTIDTVTFVISD